jgi:polyisoprenoid-binding protein YceI
MTTAATTAPALTTFTIDPSHTEAGFAVKHLMISTVRGRFADVTGQVAFDPSDLTTGSVDVSINTTSVDTREEKRDAHLRSADFFDVEQFPVITFKSRRIQNVTGDAFQVVGDLTIKGVTREVVLEAENQGLQKDPWGGERAGFSAKTVINRKDYGLGWNVALETGGILVGEDVKINLDVELIKAS